jgi:hypothetical protein
MTAPELKRYACSETGGGEIIEWPNGEYVRFADVEAYTQAAIAAAMMGAVKPLEWDIQNMARDTWGNHYEVRQVGNKWELDHPQLMGEYIFDSEPEAKAAAQADYQTRILSALSIPTDAIAALDAMLVEAVAAWDAVLDRIRKLRGEGWESAPAVHPYDEGYLAALDAMRDTIRAMKGGE